MMKIIKHHDHDHFGGCSCGKCKEEHEERINRGFKIAQILVALAIFVFGLVAEHFEILSNFTLYIFLVAYLIVGYEVIINAIKNIFKGEFFDESFLMLLATVCAFFVAEYSEAVLVMLLFQIGEFIEDLAVGTSHKSVEKLLSMKEVQVHKLHNNEFVDVNVMDVRIDDIILVKPGERVPLDGIISKGHCNLDLSPLTGESIPVFKKENDEILSGSINMDSTLEIKVTKTYDNSTVSKILEYIENATMSKTQSERFVTRFSKIYTPCVVVAALLVIFIPTVFFHESINVWLYKACLFLVVSCPCAIVISVPLAYFIGIGVSSKKGVLMKGSNYLEMINSMDTVLFDKTGTLTKGKLAVKEVKFNDNSYIEKVASVESNSNHPIAKAISVLANTKYEVSDFKEIGGLGVSGVINGELIECNNIKPNNVQLPTKQGTVVYAYSNSKYLGYIVVVDALKDDTMQAITGLSNKGVKSVILSGDTKDNAESVAKELGINDVHSGLLPTEKVDVLDSYIKDKKGNVGFVGDGINDAPSIAKSDIGFAMGNLGSDIAVEASDVVVMNDSLVSILNAKQISKMSVRIVNENIWMVIIIKAVAMVWGLFGELPIWIAVLSDTGVCLLAILNCLRLFKLAKK